MTRSQLEAALSEKLAPVRQAQAHRAATVTEFAAVIAVLAGALGTGVVAEIAGVQPETVSRWKDNPSPHPRAESERRVRTAFRIYQDLLESEASATVRAWFLGLNPYLGEQTPMEALREGRDAAVLAAAREFREGG